MRKAFIEIIDPEDAKGSLKRAYRRVGGSRGSIAYVHQSQSLNPKAMLGHLDLYMALMYDEKSPLSRRLRELIATIVSVMNKCEYCITHHHEGLLKYWEDAPGPIEISEGKDLTNEEQVILVHVKKLVTTPWLIEEEDMKLLRAAGFNDRAILDITMITGYFSFVNRLVLGTGVRLEDKYERNYNY